MLLIRHLSYFVIQGLSQGLMSSRHLLLRSWRRCCNSASLASGLSAGVEAGTVSTLFLFFTGIVLHDHYHVTHFPGSQKVKIFCPYQCHTPLERNWQMLSENRIDIICSWDSLRVVSLFMIFEGKMGLKIEGFEGFFPF